MGQVVWVKRAVARRGVGSENDLHFYSVQAGKMGIPWSSVETNTEAMYLAV